MVVMKYGGGKLELDVYDVVVCEIEMMSHDVMVGKSLKKPVKEEEGMEEGKTCFHDEIQSDGIHEEGG